MKTPGQIAYERYTWVFTNGNIGAWDYKDEYCKNAWEEAAKVVIAAHLNQTEERTCLNCKWMRPTEANPKAWADCAWPMKIPKNIRAFQQEPIYIPQPFKDCPTWEEK